MRLSRALLLSAGRWLAVLIPIVDLTLVLTGVLDARTGLVVGLVLEAVLTVVVVAEVRAFRTAYRHGRADGRRRSGAAVLGLEATWPPVVVRLARAEVGLLRSLWWAVRGRRAVAPGELPFAYSGRFTVVLWAVCCLGALELGVVHVLTARWPVVRWTLFVLGVYALVWVVGFGLSLRQHPHLFRAGELVLRFGHIRSVRVLLEDMAAVRTGAVSGYERNLVLDDDGLVMAVMGDSNVILWFDPAVEVEVAGRLRRLTRVSFWSDDPREVAQRLRARDPSTSG